MACCAVHNALRSLWPYAFGKLTDVFFCFSFYFFYPASWPAQAGLAAVRLAETAAVDRNFPDKRRCNLPNLDISLMFSWPVLTAF